MKTKVVAGVLSRKSSVTLAHFRTAFVLLLLDMKIMRISLDYDGNEITRLLYGSYLEVMDLFFSLNV